MQVDAVEPAKFDESTDDRPVVAAFVVLAELRRSQRLFADETTAPVLDPGRGRTKTGQLWAYARDDRPSAVAIRRW